MKETDTPHVLKTQSRSSTLRHMDSFLAAKARRKGVDIVVGAVRLTTEKCDDGEDIQLPKPYRAPELGEGEFKKTKPLPLPEGFKVS